MAIDPSLYQNAIAGGASPYYNINVDLNRAGVGKVFAGHRVTGNPYNSEDVRDEFIRKLQVYTDAMLIGDMKVISSEYLYAVQAALSALRRAKQPMSSDRIERCWQEATEMKGSLPEDFAKIIQEQLTQ